jgi:ADP-ribosylglycohydrolase
VEPSHLPSPQSPPLPNCYWVQPGKLLAGEYPGDATPELTALRLERLLQAGISCFVDLTQPGELPGYEQALPPGVRYLRRPIPDHGVPAEPVQMAEILADVREALEAGQGVYVHCRAGIGRTGTVIGCLLAEQGLGSSATLTELNRLWRQSARAAHWPTVPETAEQSDYVSAWVSPGADPLLEPKALAAARTLRGRFQGALLGLAVGDALAAATQFRRPGRFTPVGDLLGGGPFDLPRGAWSDDTAMALCLAESLLECDGFDARDQVQRYRRWQQHGHLSATGQCVGITAGTARALALSQWRRQGFSGTHDPQAHDPEALSRVPAAALFFFGQGAAAGEQAAAEAARTTCQVPAVLQACRSFALALHAALAGRSKAAVVAAAQVSLPPAPGEVEAAGASAPQALATALDLFGRTMNFREAVLAAANLGGNSDVLAAVTGALAGAHYSAGGIPALWRNSLMKQALIEGYADQLLTHALLEL